MDAVFQYLKAHIYFGGLNIAQLTEIATLGTVRRLAADEILSLEGEPCEAVYFVMEGRIRSLKLSAQGREQVVNEIGAGQSFYLVPALDGGPLPTTTQAATRATLLSFSRQDFVRLVERYPSLALHVLTDFARRLRRLTTLVEDLALRSVPERLARLLIQRAESPTGHRMTQREMAAQMGTVREVVARTLAQFEGEGWIRVQRGSIEILDLTALREIAQGGPM